MFLFRTNQINQEFAKSLQKQNENNHYPLSQILNYWWFNIPLEEYEYHSQTQTFWKFIFQMYVLSKKYNKEKLMFTWFFHEKENRLYHRNFIFNNPELFFNITIPTNLNFEEKIEYLSSLTNQNYVDLHYFQVVLEPYFDHFDYLFETLNIPSIDSVLFDGKERNFYTNTLPEHKEIVTKIRIFDKKDSSLLWGQYLLNFLNKFTFSKEEFKNKIHFISTKATLLFSSNENTLDDDIKLTINKRVNLESFIDNLKEITSKENLLYTSYAKDKKWFIKDDDNQIIFNLNEEWINTMFKIFEQDKPNKLNVDSKTMWSWTKTLLLSNYKKKTISQYIKDQIKKHKLNEIEFSEIDEEKKFAIISHDNYILNQNHSIMFQSPHFLYNKTMFLNLKKESPFVYKLMWLIYEARLQNYHMSINLDEIKQQILSNDDKRLDVVYQLQLKDNFRLNKK